MKYNFSLWNIILVTSYLTIGSYDSESELYELRFPNREVEIGFLSEISSYKIETLDKKG